MLSFSGSGSLISGPPCKAPSFALGA